jgi:hypothetical protein
MRSGHVAAERARLAAGEHDPAPLAADLEAGDAVAGPRAQ